MIVPYNKLSEAALQALIEDFVTRDGTDYGQNELNMQEKAEQLMTALQRGELLISYNEETESCGLVTREEHRKQGKQDGN